MRQQQGFSFWGFLFSVVPIVIVVLLGMVLFPAYSEFFAVKKAVAKIGNDPSISSMSDADIRTMMDKAIEVDLIHSVKSTDLVIQHAESGTTVSVDYEVVVPLVANISALLSFSATTDKAHAAASAAAAG